MLCAPNKKRKRNLSKNTETPDNVETEVQLPETKDAAQHINNILKENPVWNQDVVDQLLRWGMHPEMVETRRIHRSSFVNVECVFRNSTNGAFVYDVWLPLCLLKNQYKSFVEHIQ